jgi:hypothetical protein
VDEHKTCRSTARAATTKYWVGRIPAGTYGATNEVEYYLRITYSDRDTTYLGTTNQTASFAVRR